jgi:hypothetical protein
MSADINFDFLDKTKKILFSYEGKIPEGLSHYYRDILEGKNIEMYMQTYSLSKETLIRYARICKIREVYEEISDLVDILKTEMDALENSEIAEYQNLIDDLQTIGESYMVDIDEEDVVEEDLHNSDDINMTIYTNFIDESYDSTVNSHSGREEQSLNAIGALIEKLNKTEYLELRKKGEIHQIHQNQQVDGNKAIIVDGSAFERIGKITTKVNYFRIPISDNNKKEINKSINKYFDTLFLVVSYGDFKNEGLDESRFYQKNYFAYKKHYAEIELIMNIFKNDFTEETFPIAMDFISEGFRITRNLTSSLKRKSEVKPSL